MIFSQQNLSDSVIIGFYKWEKNNLNGKFNSN